jgi:predicted RNA-binding Zn-ribbon protein involved in translation (DUF1610 family)
MRLHAENPELTDEELTDLAMRGTPKPIAKDETRYDFTCPKCGDEYRVSKEMNDWLLSQPRLPKCSACYL